MKRNNLVRMLAAVIAAVVLPLAATSSVAAKDYLVVGTKPDRLFLVDLQARKVVRQYRIPGRGFPFSISASPDGRIAYVLTDRMGAISGINLDTGKQVFRAEFSTPGLRIKSMGGMTLSHDGKEIFVQESPTKLLSDQYEVQPPRIAVYQTDGGLKAEPVRSFPIPRRVAVLLPSTDGKILYALGWDMYAFDASSGKLLKTYEVLHWKRPHASVPDLLNFWPMDEQTNIFAAPYFYSRTDVAPDNPAANKTGILTLNLNNGEFHMTDFENTSAIIFSAVVDPKNTNQIFGVFNTLSRIKVGDHPELEKRAPVGHTYYLINISKDGSECYLGGTMNDVAVYSTKTLKQLGDIKLPGGGDMGLSLMRIVDRH
jgi:quinohemoprotein amine dehydrogenase beta subunit